MLGFTAKQDDGPAGVPISVLSRLLVLLVLMVLWSAPVQAGWFTKLLKEAGEAVVDDGGKLARRKATLKGGSLSFDEASRFVTKLPPPAKTGRTALAVEVSQEGHWRFANKAGEVVTAGTPEELKRAVSLLAPSGAGAGAKANGTARDVSLYLSQNSIFKHGDLLKDLPPHAGLFIVADGASYPLAIRNAKAVGEGAKAAAKSATKSATEAGAAASLEFYVKLQPRLTLKLTSRAHLKEALWQIRRPLNRSVIRLLSLQPGARRFVPANPRRAPPGAMALPDVVDPHALLTSMATIRGQTVIVQGQLKRGYLRFQPGSGSEGAVKLSRLFAAAAREDVNLIVLHTNKGVQPGARNWLWMRFGVEGFERAVKQKNHGAFINALAPPGGTMALRLRKNSADRVTLSVRPAGLPDDIKPPGDAPTFSDQWSDALSSITGNLVQRGAELSLRSNERQEELDLRIIPGIPAGIQFFYLALIIVGVLALSVSRRWWRRIWPLEKKSDYGTRIGFFAARGIRGGLFILVFLPLTAPFSLLTHLLLKLWHFITMPLRVWRWLRDTWREA